MNNRGVILLITLIILLPVVLGETAAPADIDEYYYHIVNNEGMPAALNLFLNDGGGYLYDGGRGAWFKIPYINHIEPPFCKASDRLAMIYGWDRLMVYDSRLPSGENWVLAAERNFSSLFSASAYRYASQINDQMALAVGDEVVMIYDSVLSRWIGMRVPTDLSGSNISENIRLTTSLAQVKTVHGDVYVYGIGSGAWRKK